MVRFIIDSELGKKLDTELLKRIKEGNYGDEAIESVANDLLLEIKELFRYVATHIFDDFPVQNWEINEAIRTLRILLDILRIDSNIPWSDFDNYKVYHSYMLERDRLEKIEAEFQEVGDKLSDLESRRYREALAVPVPRIDGEKFVVWESVDRELSLLHDLFYIAKNESDYSDVGNRCVRVLESLGDAVYDPIAHERESGEKFEKIGRGQTKNRFEWYIGYKMAGKDNEQIRKLTKSAVEYAQAVKHSRNPTEQEAGLAADVITLLVHIFKRMAV
ncbi:hypothetical protein [Rothia nasimurium]|uniref:hypothetical protein n=1 Tax=Rothia nasimurium TaxID=85336 RepID=UPI001F43A58E|nr:hypothetical protein [Rothia nasimurium]